MNNKKRIMLIVLVAVMLAAFALALVACNGYEDSSEKTVVIYIGDKEFELTTRNAFLHSALKELKAKGEISKYEYSGEGISAFLTQIDDLMQNADEYKYYSVWHSVDEFSLKSVYSGYAPTRGEQRTEGEAPYQTTFVATTYKNKTLYYSNVGVGLLPLVDGATYAILVD